MQNNDDAGADADADAADDDDDYDADGDDDDEFGPLRAFVKNLIVYAACLHSIALWPLRDFGTKPFSNMQYLFNICFFQTCIFKLIFLNTKYVVSNKTTFSIGFSNKMI